MTGCKEGVSDYFGKGDAEELEGGLRGKWDGVSDDFEGLLTVLVSYGYFLPK